MNFYEIDTTLRSCNVAAALMLPNKRFTRLLGENCSHLLSRARDSRTQGTSKLLVFFFFFFWHPPRILKVNTLFTRNPNITIQAVDVINEQSREQIQFSVFFYENNSFSRLKHVGRAVGAMSSRLVNRSGNFLFRRT